MVPSEAGFHCHGQLNGVDYGTCYLKHLGNVTQHTCSGTFSGNFLYGASEVYVKNVGCGLLDYLGGLYHRFGFPTVNLYCRGAFSRVYVELACCSAYVAYESIGRYEFGVDHVGSLFLTDEPKRVVGDILHWSEHHRAFS